MKEYPDPLNDASPGYSYTVDLYYEGVLVKTVTRSRTGAAGGPVGAEWSKTRELKLALPAGLETSDGGVFTVEFQGDAWVTCLDDATFDQGAAKACPATTPDHAIHQAVLTYADRLGPRSELVLP